MVSSVYRWENRSGGKNRPFACLRPPSLQRLSQNLEPIPERMSLNTFLYDARWKKCLRDLGPLGKKWVGGGRLEKPDGVGVVTRRSLVLIAGWVCPWDLGKQGADSNQPEWTKLAERARESCDICPKVMQMWQRQKHRQRNFRKLCSQMRLVIFILWPPLHLQ